MTTLLERQRAAKLTDAQLTALDMLCRHGLLWRCPNGWRAGAEIVATSTMEALVERGLVRSRNDIASATPEGQALHLQITRGAP